jgi:hypothetical protein
MAVKCSGARKKSLEMSGAIKYLESSNIFSRNPSNRSDNMTIEEFLDKQATTIQKCLRGEALKRAAKAMQRLATYQSYCKELMLYLGKSLAMRDGLSLLLGAEDPEIAATYTDSDKLFVLDKARHIHDALCIMVNYTEANKCITWLRCCELSAEMNFNQYTGRTIMKWYLQLHERRDSKKIFVFKMDAFFPWEIIQICKVAILRRRKPHSPIQILGSIRSRDFDCEQSPGMDQ